MKILKAEITLKKCKNCKFYECSYGIECCTIGICTKDDDDLADASNGEDYCDEFELRRSKKRKG
jgi:hypothetical protein